MKEIGIRQNEGYRKALMEDAKACMEEHKKVYESWYFGDISEVWIDANCNLCIRYDNGTWFHYKTVNGELNWW